VQDLTQHARGDELAEGGNARCPAEGEADADHRVSVAGEVRHGAGVREVVAQRLLAEYVFAGGDQALHDLTMQGVGYDHADDVDFGVLRNSLPGGVGALARRVAREPSSGLMSPIETNRRSGSLAS
jgi:hypothetical protein